MIPGLPIRLAGMKGTRRMASSHSARRFARLLVVAWLAALAFFDLSPVAAQAGRSWQALAQCTANLSGAAHPNAEVTISNNTGLLLHVAYARSFATAPAIGTVLTGLKLADPGPQKIINIPDGSSASIIAPWAGDVPAEGSVVVVLVVTSAGIAMPSCVNVLPTIVRLPDPTPTLAGEEATESATIAAKTIGQLEAWRAYAPLYALLHPDAQAQFSFAKIACWYVGHYGPLDGKESVTIYDTTVKKVTFVDWTWAGGLKHYQGAAEVSLTQDTGVFPNAGETVSAVEHLVRVQGVWRWFFGSAVDSAAHMTESCGLPTSA